MRRPRLILWRCYTYNIYAREKGKGESSSSGKEGALSLVAYM